MVVVVMVVVVVVTMTTATKINAVRHTEFLLCAT
jgi:hypothetical protein